MTTLLETLQQLNQEHGRPYGSVWLQEMARISHNDPLVASLVFEVLRQQTLTPETMQDAIDAIHEKGIGVSIAQDILKTNHPKTLVAAALYARENSPVLQKTVAAWTKINVTRISPYLIVEDQVSIRLQDEVYQLLLKGIPTAIAMGASDFSPEFIQLSSALT